MSVYRIMSFARLCELFEYRRFTLVRPEKWDDPFENYLSSAVYRRGSSTIEIGGRRSIFGSCWTRRAASDAMWRIYSSDKTSVRVKTTPLRLANSLDSALAKRSAAQGFIGRVEYLPERDIVSTARDRAIALYKSTTREAIASTYLFKRNPFSHEAEVRVLVVDGNARPAAGGLLHLPLNPSELVESILVDPRAPDSMVEMYKRHLQAAYGFKKHVAKSTIYRPPKPLVIDLGKK